jgi:hypothetical protein
MATTINASTVSGLIQTADTSGILELQSNGSTVVSVTSTGASILGSTVSSLLNTQYFTTAGTSTYTPTTGTKYIIVEVVGAGAGGTNGNGTGAGPSGGGGAYARKKITSSFSGVTVTVGAKTSANTATQAGSSSFGSIVTCGGGYGTTGVGAPNLNSGVATGGDINIRGALGNGGGSSGSPGVPGGWSAIGGCAGQNQSGVYGGGGGNNGVGTCTATGGDGIVIIYEYS